MATNMIHIESTTSVATDGVANKVGIGTSVPAELLHLAASGSAKEQIGSFSTTTTNGPVVQFTKSASNTVGTLTKTTDGHLLGRVEIYGVNDAGTPAFAKAARIDITQEGAVGAGSSFVPGKIDFQTSTGSADVVSRLTIRKDGPVGIGTTNPTEALDIVGSIWQLQFTPAVGKFVNRNGGTISTGDSLGGFEFWGNASGNYYESGDIMVEADANWSVGSAPTRITISTAPSGSTAAVERMRIAPSGNVGIGTNNPGEKLEVSGNVKVGASDKFLIGSVEIKSGSGAPAGGDGAPQGSLYLRTDGGATTTLYVKTAASTWTAK